MPEHAPIPPLLREAGEHFLAGRLGDSERLCRQAIQQHPDSPDAWDLLGLLAMRAGRSEPAVECHLRAVRLDPSRAAFHVHLADANRMAHKLDLAIAGYRAALRLDPRAGGALLNLGAALAASGRADEAADAWRAAVALDPDDAEALWNLANLSSQLGRFADTVAYSQRALRLVPGRAALLSNLGIAYEQQGRLDDAIACFREALAASPHHELSFSNLLRDLSAHATAPPGEVFAEHVRWGDAFAAPLRAHHRPHGNDPSPDRRLRIGYVSPDFRDHAVASFVEPILAGHDRERFEVFCYSAAPRIDAVTKRLQAYGQAWRNIVGVADAAAAEMVRRDAIDILVDLAGHTAGHRLLLMARRPAPVQVTYLGYPNTTGLKEIDYRVTDALADPPGEADALHSERLVRLPRCGWCYRPPDDAPPVAAEPPSDRRDGRITFGSFNAHAKTSPQTVAAWAAVLRAAPGSRLLLKAYALGESDTRQLLLKRFADAGIGAERLDLRGPTATRAEHLAAYGEVDVALDPFPYNGTTTTCEAMWMGVPVVTLAGRSHIARVGVSLLSAVGLGDLVASSPEQYVATATALAADAARRQELRRNLRATMAASPLCDGAAMTRALEAAYRAMWQKWCSAGR